MPCSTVLLRNLRYLVLVLLVAAFVFQDDPVQDYPAGEERSVALVNNERSSRGLAPLRVDSELRAIARRHSERMASDATIYHNKNLPNEVNGEWCALAENVGMGSTIEKIHNAFMDSEPHRKNILGNYTHIGVGVSKRDGIYYVTEVFELRCSPRPTPPPAKKKAPPPATTPPRCT